MSNTPATLATETAPDSGRRGSIAVIGGGYTGMTAARRLALRGYDVTLYEGGPALGGLAAGVPFHGTTIEHTYHHLFNTDESIIGLARELGVEESLQFHDSSVGIYRDGTIYPFNGAGDLLRFRPLNFVNRLRVGVVALWLQRSRRYRHLVGQSAYDWMLRRAGKQATDVIWEPLLRGKFHRYYRDVSMAWLWSRLNIRTNSRAEQHSSEQLGYFNGGFSVFTSALEESMRSAGVTVHLNSRISRIRSDGHDAGVTVVTADGEDRHDRVLATIPSYILASLVETSDERYLDQLRSVDYIGAAVAVFSTEQDLGDTYWININEPDAPFLVLLQHTNLVPASRYEGRHVYYVGTYVPHDHRYFTDPDAVVMAEWYAYIKKMFPAFDPASADTCSLGRFRNAQHVPDVGYASKMPDHRTPVSGVYLANFSQLFPVDRGTNYAVRDGERVARMIADDREAVHV